MNLASRVAKQKSVKNRVRCQSGFTIIEVVIVLAIMGIMMSIIFLAIPTLERNSRNNQRKQDVTAVLDAVSKHMLNNAASFPPNNNYLQFTKLSFYERTDADIQRNFYPSSNFAPATRTVASGFDGIAIHNYQRCDPDVQGTSTRQGASYRNVVALYNVETANDVAPKCQEM